MKCIKWVIYILSTAITACSDSICDIYSQSNHAITYEVETTEHVPSRSVETVQMTSEQSSDTLYAYISDYQPIASRGIPINSVDELTEDISVSGYYRPENSSGTSSASALFENEILDYNTNFKTIKSGNIYYWPTSGMMDFYAIYPADIDNFKFDYYNKTIEYTTPEEASDQKDILLSTNTGLTGKDNGDSAVGLIFNHICSRLTFQLDANLGENSVIEKIEIHGISRKGTYDVTTNTWDIDTDDEYMDIIVNSLAQPTQIGSTIYTGYLATDEKTLMVIPQNISNISLTITVGQFRQSETNANNYEISNSLKWTCDLNNLAGDMKPGKSYYITITKDGEGSEATFEDKGQMTYVEYDSYNNFKKYSFNIKEDTQDWAIVADVDWLTFSKKEMATYQALGFWVDKESGSAIVRGTHKDAIDNVITVWAYCTENLNKDESREAEIMLIEDGQLTKCLFLKQLPPKESTARTSLISTTTYYTANYEYEDISSNKTVSCWGFYNWPTITFTSSTVDFESLIAKEDQQEAIDILDSSSDIYKYISLSKSNGSQTLTINFNETWDFVIEKGTGSTDYDGIGNTTKEFFHNKVTNNVGDNKGLWHMLQMALAFYNRNGVEVAETNGSLNDVIDCAIVRAVQYNKFRRINKYGTQVPEITESELHWYLPAQNETNNSNLEVDTEYWSSTAGTRAGSKIAFSFSYTKSIFGTNLNFSIQWNSPDTKGYRIMGAVTI
jgi:hypothetical protein